MTNTPPGASHNRLSLLVDAVGSSEADRAFQDLFRAFDGPPTTVIHHDVGLPPLRVRRLRFASGGEIVLHDDVVVCAILHTSADHDGEAVTLAEWIPGVPQEPTLDDLKVAFGSRPTFGSGSPYFAIGAGFAQVRFDRRAKGGWLKPGHLRRIVVTVVKPGLMPPPDAECPVCSPLPVIAEDGSLDVDETVARLKVARAEAYLRESAYWAPIHDLQDIHASGLMRMVESQLHCATCQRVLCLTLYRNGAPTFGYSVMNDALHHQMEPIPPVDQWGDDDRILKSRNAMRYVDHQPTEWFLVQQQDRYFLDARYSSGASIDDSALIELDAEELRAYREEGRDYLHQLAQQIHMSCPYTEDSPYYARDLFRRGGEPGRNYRREVSAAIADHTWRAGQLNRT